MSHPHENEMPEAENAQMDERMMEPEPPMPEKRALPTERVEMREDGHVEQRMPGGLAEMPPLLGPPIKVDAPIRLETPIKLDPPPKEEASGPGKGDAPPNAMMMRYAGKVVNAARPGESLAGFKLEVRADHGVIKFPKDPTSTDGVVLGAPGTFEFDHVFDGSGRSPTPTFSFVVRAPNGNSCTIVSGNAVVPASQARDITLRIDAAAAALLPTLLFGTPATTPRLRGRVIDRAGQPYKFTSFLLLVARDPQPPGAPRFEPLLPGTTDGTGSFSLPMPAGSFAGLRAVVAAVPEEVVDVPHAGGPLPGFVLIVTGGVQKAAAAAEGGCNCEDPPSRLPAMEDLVSPASRYQQDIGGSCMNLSTPNRALEEFAFATVVRNTDPEVMSAPGYIASLEQRLARISKSIAEAEKITTNHPEPGKTSTNFIDGLRQLGNADRSAVNALIDRCCADGGLPNDPDRYKAESSKYVWRFQLVNCLKWAEALTLEAKYGPASVTPAAVSALDLEGMKLERDRIQDELTLARIRASANGLVQRTGVSHRNPIQWDSPLPLVQPSTIAHGHLLQFRQVWRADGYSLGDLLYSLPLAPGQAKQIVVHDWERRETASRSESTSSEESLSNELSQDRAVNEIVDATLNEHSKGSSKSSTKGFSMGVGGAVSAGGEGPVAPGVNVKASVGFSGGISGGKSSSSSSSEQTSSRDMTSSTMQNVREKTMQHASAVRSQRTSVITTMTQAESTTITTESIANNNHCHAITVEYFEVLRHLAVHTELVDVQECLFVPLTISLFDDTKVVRWSDLLRYALRAPRSQIGRLRRGFEAIRRYYAVNAQGLSDEEVYRTMPAGRYCDERVSDIRGTFRLRIHFACPKKVVKTVGKTDLDALASLSAAAQPLSAFLPGGLGLRRHFRDAFIDQGPDRALWATTLGFVKEVEHIRSVVNLADDEDREAVFQAEMQKVNAAGQFARKLALRVAVPDRVLDAHISMTRAGSAARRGEATPYDFAFRCIPARLSVERDEITSLGVGVAQVLPEGSQVVLERFAASYSSPYVSRALCSAAPGDDLLVAPATIATPLSDDELVSPRQEDLQLRSELLDHLNSNVEYYHKAIWAQMDEDRRLMLLDGFEIDVPARENPAYSVPGGPEPEYLTPRMMRSVASVVENRLVGIVGNALVMPVARGYNLNPLFRFADDAVEIDGKKTSRLMAHYMPEKGFADTPFRISLPTKGVFAEAVMGACNSCEKIDDSRFWKWEEHPNPNMPTAISPVNADSRRADPGSLAASPLAASQLALQEGRALPDPTGLARALELLGKGDSFRDMAGLAATQANAIQALQLNTEAAQQYAKTAADLAMSAEIAKNGDKVAKTIRNNVTDPAAADEMVGKYFGNLSGGAQSAAAAAAAEGEWTPMTPDTPLSRLDVPATVDAVKGIPGAEVSVTKDSVTVKGGTRSLADTLPRDEDEAVDEIKDTAIFVLVDDPDTNRVVGRVIPGRVLQTRPPRLGTIGIRTPAGLQQDWVRFHPTINTVYWNARTWRYQVKTGVKPSGLSASESRIWDRIDAADVAIRNQLLQDVNAALGASNLAAATPTYALDYLEFAADDGHWFTELAYDTATSAVTMNTAAADAVALQPLRLDPSALRRGGTLAGCYDQYDTGLRVRVAGIGGPTTPESWALAANPTVMLGGAVGFRTTRASVVSMWFQAPGGAANAQAIAAEFATASMLIDGRIDELMSHPGDVNVTTYGAYNNPNGLQFLNVQALSLPQGTSAVTPPAALGQNPVAIDPTVAGLLRIAMIYRPATPNPAPPPQWVLNTNQAWVQTIDIPIAANTLLHNTMNTITVNVTPPAAAGGGGAVTVSINRGAAVATPLTPNNTLITRL